MLMGLIAATWIASLGWRGMFIGAGALPLVLGPMLLLASPESLRHLQRRGAAGRAAIERLAQALNAPASLVQAARPIEPGRPRGNWSALFGRREVATTALLWLSFIACYIAMYLPASWLPTVLTRQHLPLAQASLGIVAFNSAGLLGGLTASWTAGRWGTRIPLALLTGMGALWSIGLAAWVVIDPAPPAIGLILLCGAQGFFAIGLMTSLLAVAANAYPPHVRSTGAGAALAAARVGAIASAYLGAATLGFGGTPAYFAVTAVSLTLACCCILALRRHIPAPAKIQ
jgi:AAHS family 4-hydroxybenzoate transporter-like MFS transporter